MRFDGLRTNTIATIVSIAADSDKTDFAWQLHYHRMCDIGIHSEANAGCWRVSIDTTTPTPSRLPHRPYEPEGHGRVPFGLCAESEWIDLHGEGRQLMSESNPS
jgi:hypothetical protein